ncbi:hypothetical protein N5C67_10395 [Comamonas thiooxydans]|uniref:hypothetical protein n=1 Tax=Comamonas thiooxydans TaxID=363952 RepID=UPI00244BDA6F|nr:hypothetical protein [Comamonas thiooxydans]MDH1253062.1 hypothetical protein [Comamonas thiooxydans]
MKFTRMLISALMLSCIGSSAISAGKTTKRIQQPAVAQDTGPLGIGELKIGMSKVAVDQLNPLNNVYLDGELTQKFPDYRKMAPGEELYEGRLKTALASQSFRVFLTYQDGLLVEMSVSSDGHGTPIKTMADQVQAKYGDGTFKNEMKEEQCVYRNGAAFKIDQGKTARTWVQKTSDVDSVSTEFSVNVMDMCPSSLNMPRMPKSLFEVLRIKKVLAPSPADTPKLF